MYKLYSLLLLGLTMKQNLSGQTAAKDSVTKTVHLHEVCIYDENDNKNQAFNFYRNSKLATTEDVLSRMEGVNLIKRGAYGLEPTLRNYGSGQSNLTIEGMRIYGACTDKMDPVSIYVEPINLQSIQVSHGASGALEGSTIGGQISMKLKEPGFGANSKPHGQLAQSYMTVNNGYHSALALQQSFKKLAYRVNGTYRKADNYLAGDHIRIQHSGFEKLNTSVAVLYKLPKTQTLKIDYLGDWGKNIGFPALPMDVGRASAHIAAFTHQLEIKNSFFLTNEFKIYYNNIFHSMDDTHRSDAPMHMDMPGWSNTAGCYNELKGRNNFMLRVDYHQAYTRADMTMYPSNEPIMYMQTLPENNLKDLGLAIGKEFEFKKNQRITVNGRMDLYVQNAAKGIGSQQWQVYATDITQTKQNLLKNVNIAYSKRFKERTTGRLSVGYGERIPTSNERYGYYLFNRQDQYDYIGNLNLNPEQSYQAELLFKQEYKKIQYSVNVFYHHTQNYIYAYQLTGFGQMTIGAYGLKTYKNIDAAISSGFEATVKIQLLNKLSYIGNMKYVQATTESGTPLPLVPPFKLQEALRYVSGLYQVQIEHDCAAKQAMVNVDYGDKITPGFNTFNFRASKNTRIKSSVLQLSIACENIFDTHYREHLDIGSIPRFGRNFMFNVNFIF